MEKITVDAMEVWKYLQLGLPEEVLMKTFKLTKIQLFIVCDDLKQAGLLGEGLWCPKCGFMHAEPFVECLKCGVVFYKLGKRIQSYQKPIKQRKQLKVLLKDLWLALAALFDFMMFGWARF